MNLTDIMKILRENNIPKIHYRIGNNKKGPEADVVYILQKNGQGYKVADVERGNEFDVLLTQSESEACESFLNRLSVPFPKLNKVLSTLK